MKLVIGLVVKEGVEFIEQWVECIERLKCDIIVVDNGADKEIKERLIYHPQVIQYHIQNFPGRNQSRDYQKILDMAREEKADWIWNLDIDEYVSELNIDNLLQFLLNCSLPSAGLPLIEMRNDNEHYVMVKEANGELRNGRLVHKIYKTLSHFAFDKNDIHGCSIPHNCPREKNFIPILVQHYGHYTKELRDQKRKRSGHDKDIDEYQQTWFEEDKSKITIKSWSSLIKEWKEKYQ